MDPAPTQLTDFDVFCAEAEPRLRRALVGAVGVDRAGDAAADALVWAWEHWGRVQAMQNPVGYLWRVARSSTRVRRPARVRFLIEESARIPEVEPALLPALKALPEQQRIAVWMVHACGWTHREVGEALDISTSAVSTHVARGMQRLRTELTGEAR